MRYSLTITTATATVAAAATSSLINPSGSPFGIGSLSTLLLVNDDSDGGNGYPTLDNTNSSSSITKLFHDNDDEDRCTSTDNDNKIVNTTGTENYETKHNYLLNKRWILTRRPRGRYNAHKDATLITEKISLKKYTNHENGNNDDDDEMIIRNDILSIDAFIRTMLGNGGDDDDSGIDQKSYHGSIDIGSTLPAIGYGTVIYAGKSAKYKVGTGVMGMLNAQKYVKIDGSTSTSSLGIVKKKHYPFMSPITSFGLMGLTIGLTAYVGLFFVPTRPPQKGETVVITAAAGAVGTIAAQLAKTTGARVIGITGGPRKVDFLINELGIHDAIDYKKSISNNNNNKEDEYDLQRQIKEVCPNGIDFIYDNVGGPILDMLLQYINPKGRIVICGAISQYSGNLNNNNNNTDGDGNRTKNGSTSTSSRTTVYGPTNYLKLAEVGAEMKGFNVLQYKKYFYLARLGIYWLYLRGKVKFVTDIMSSNKNNDGTSSTTTTNHNGNNRNDDNDDGAGDGIELFSIALEKLYTGGNIGKIIIKM